MRKFNLGEWSNIADIVGMVAVVISLVFVGYSLERNTTALAGSNENDLYSELSQINLALLSTPEAHKAYVKGSNSLSAFGSMTPFERDQYRIFVSLHIDLWNRAITREAEGLMQTDTLEEWNHAD